MDILIDFHPRAIAGIKRRGLSEDDVERVLEQSDRDAWREMWHVGPDTYSVRGQTSDGRNIQVVFVDKGGYLLVMGVFLPLIP